MDKEEFEYLANTHDEVYNPKTGEYEKIKPVIKSRKRSNGSLPSILFR